MFVFLYFAVSAYKLFLFPTSIGCNWILEVDLTICHGIVGDPVYSSRLEKDGHLIIPNLRGPSSISSKSPVYLVVLTGTERTGHRQEKADLKSILFIVCSNMFH